MVFFCVSLVPFVNLVLFSFESSVVVLDALLLFLYRKVWPHRVTLGLFEFGLAVSLMVFYVLKNDLYQAEFTSHG